MALKCSIMYHVLMQKKPQKARAGSQKPIKTCFKMVPKMAQCKSAIAWHTICHVQDSHVMAMVVSKINVYVYNSFLHISSA